MPANSYVQAIPSNPKSTAVVEVNTLSEDAQTINPADHDGKIFQKKIFFLNDFFFRCTIGLYNSS